MKRIFSVLLVVAMLLSVCVPIGAVDSAATLLYSFGSFEGKDSSAYSGAWRTFQYSEDYAKSGTVSLKAVGGDEMHTKGILWFKITGITFESGKTYSVRFYAMSEGNTATVDAMLYDNTTNTTVSTSYSKRAITIGSWCEYVAVFDWGTNAASSSVSLRVDTNGLDNIYVDDLEIYEGTLVYDKTQWQDADFAEITPDSTPAGAMIPDDMTLHNYTMDFENGSSVQISGKNVTAQETGNERYKSQLIADPEDADNTVMKVWLASDVSGEGQYSGKNQNNYAFRNILFSQSVASTSLAVGTIPAGATFKMSFRYYLPQEMESSNNPSFSYYYNTGSVRRLVPSMAPSTVHNQWHTVEMSWTNSTGSEQVITQGGFRLCGNNDSGNGWKASWAAKGHASTDSGVTFNFGDRAIYLDDFRIVIEDSNGDIVENESAIQLTTVGATSGNLYVDKDAAAGGNGSKSAPFNTIEAARDYIRTISDSMTGDIVVNVKGGTYRVEDTIELTTADSGKNGHYIIYQPYGYDTENEEEVILSGGKEVTGWTESEISGVYKAPLEIDYLRNLYVNDQRAQRARYNEYVTPIEWWDDTEDTLSTKDGFVIPGGIIKDPEKATNLEIYKTVTFRSNWAVRGKAEASGDNTVIKMEQPYFRMHEYANYSILDWRITDDFRLENALEFLNEPGEWYHDADTDTLYYMPRDGESIDTCRVIAPDTEQILTITGDGIDERAENIVVRGFTFSEGALKKTSRIGRANLQGASCYSIIVDKGAVYGGFQDETAGNIIVYNAKNVSFTDNVIKHMGGVGITMPDGVDNCEIKGNAIYDISSSAVVVGANVHFAVSDWRIVPRNVHITNNIIGDTGVEYGTDCGIQGYYTNGLVISHNEIYNTTYSAVSVGWTWNSTEDTKRNNVIEYNRIYSFGTACQDAGGIYTLGRQPNSIVRGNYLKCYAQYITGLYHDSGSSGFSSTGNVIEVPADSCEPCFYKNSIGDGDLFISGNYATNYERRFVSTTAAVMCDNDLSQGAVRSEEALAIREASGLAGDYRLLRDKISGYSENTEIQQIYLQTEEQKQITPANIEVGETLTLKTFAEQKNGEMRVLTDGLTYSVIDGSVLSISGDKVCAVAEGITTVTVTDAAGRSAHMQITVGDEVVSCEVVTDKLSAEVGANVQVNYRVKTKFTEFVGVPEMSEIKLSDSAVAAVLSDGIIKTTQNGNVTITVNAKVAGFTVSGSTSLPVGGDTYRTFKMLTYISKLSQEDIQSYLGDSADSAVTEKKFAEVLAAVTESDIAKISTAYTEDTLTMEKMAAFAADALVNVYGVAQNGNTEIYYYTDRADIDPSLVPKVALAYRNNLLSWVDGKTEFNPKSEITAAEAAEFLYRFAHPENVQYVRHEEGHFNRYVITCGELYTNQKNGTRARTKQWGFEAAGEECVDLSGTYGDIKSGVWMGTDGVAIDAGSLVRKVTRENYSDTTIVTFNDVEFVPGKNYLLEFSAKLPDTFDSYKKCNVAVECKFTTESGTGTATATAVSSDGWTKFTVPISIAADTELTDDNNSVHIRLTNRAVGSYVYDTTVYTVLFKDIVFTEAADTTISSSSIADGEENVMTPVDSLYIYTSSAVDATTVTADKFTVTGTNATIRDAEAIDERTIRVGIDGCVGDESYTLSTSGVQNFTDGYLTGSITWKTASAVSDVNRIDFEDDTYLGVLYSGGTRERSTEQAYRNSSSVKVTTTAAANLYINARYAGFRKFELGKEYVVSYSIYSTTASARTGICKHHSTADIYMAEVQTIAQNQWVTLSGTFKPTADSDVADDILKINLWGDPGDYYIDDITVTEVKDSPVTVYRPNIFRKDIPVSGLAQGDNNVEIKLAGGNEDKTVWAVIAQYEENGRLISTTMAEPAEVFVAAGAEEVININLSVANSAQIKIFVMDSESLEPYSKVICMDN